METFLQYVLYIHILAGFTALVVGLVPMFSQKGRKGSCPLGESVLLGYVCRSTHCPTPFQTRS